MKLTSKTINYTVETVEELETLAGEENSTVIVTDENRGGVFVYRSANATENNGGTIFNGWTRQYDGVVNVKWFGAVGDGITDDTTAIQAAVDSLSENQTIYFDSSIYATNGVITFTTDRIGVTFDNSRFDVGDTGADATTVSGATGKIGFHFKQINKLKITGASEFIGTGTVGVTSLLGVMFDNCADVQCPADMKFETMAIGRTISNCTRSTFGDVSGNDMNGLQPFESPPTNNAGSVQTLSGTSYSTFGNTLAYNIEKPAVYLSVATGANDNAFCTFGNIVCDGVNTDPTTAHALALRSAVDCSFGSIVVNGTFAGVVTVQYSGDEAYSVDRVNINSITGNFLSTGASVDACYSQETTSTNSLGNISIGNIDAVCSGEFGILCSSGTLNIESAKINGSTRPFVGRNSCVNIGKIEISNQSDAAFTIGQQLDLNVSFIDIKTGTAGFNTGAVYYNTAFGSGGVGDVNIGTIRYRHNSIETNVLYVFADLTNSFENINVLNIDGVGSLGAARYVSDTFGSIINGDLLTIQPPTTGSYTEGSKVYDVSPSASGNIGWVCTTAGTPGTWKTFGTIGA